MAFLFCSIDAKRHLRKLPVNRPGGGILAPRFQVGIRRRSAHLAMKGSKTSFLILFALALLAAGPAWGAASEWSVNPPSRVRLITAWEVAPKTGELWMGFHFKLAPGWHVYWKNSGDAGFPPAATFQPAEVLGEPELLWPTPHRFELPGGLV